MMDDGGVSGVDIQADTAERDGYIASASVV